ncbi:MAG: hypothetical protein AAB525_00245 [Patescibacteria group bacterium]
MSRLDKAVELYNQSKVDRFVLCGGKFAQGMEESAAAKSISLELKILLQDKNKDRYGLVKDRLLTEE